MSEKSLSLTDIRSLPSESRLVTFPRAGERFRHSPLYIFLLGGILGSGLNLGVTGLLHEALGWHPLPAFFIGTLANLLFHHAYYALVFVNQEISMKTALPLQLLLYLGVSFLGSGLLWVFYEALQLEFIQAVLGAIALLSLLSVTLVRISTFSSAKLAEIEYQEVDESFYDDQTDRAKVGWFRAWFHSSRFERLTRFVAKYYRPGMRIADLGCGNCMWNVHELPVTGVDMNEKMMDWAKRHHRLQEYLICGNLGKTGLPAKSFDLVIMSETLEHLLNLPETLAEVRRILKDDGTFLITVPYDIFLGPFFILFNVNCLYQGYVKGSTYHKYRCGHVNHFSISRLKNLLAANGFQTRKYSIVNGLNIYAAAGKT
jgi:SAM-dependent methyltransferase